MGSKLWGITAGSEAKPSWLNADEKERTFATSSGWAIRHPDGTVETLVAVKGLNTKLSTASIMGVVFASGTYTAGVTKAVKVSFNEKVTVTGTPTLVITSDLAGDVTASYSTSNASGTTLTFTFTVPAAGNVLSVGTQSVALAGGTITETGITPTVNASLVISAEVGTAAGTKTAV